MLRAGDAFIHTKKVVCNLGVLFDSNVSVLPYITRVECDQDFSPDITLFLGFDNRSRKTSRGQCNGDLVEYD